MEICNSRGKVDDRTMAERACIALSCLSLAVSCGRSGALHANDGGVRDGAAVVQPDAEICCSAALRGAFLQTGSMTAARLGHAASLLGDGRVLIVGGEDLKNSSLRAGTAEIFDSRAGIFTATGSLPEVRSYSTSTLLENRRVLVAGGMAGISVGGTSDVQAELYDPQTGMFSETGRLTAGQRVYSAATLLPDGNVLVTGGLPLVSQAPVDPHADLYDVGAGVFKTTGNMTVARFQHTGILLPNGNVLVAGGNGNGSVNASAELYDPSTGTFESTASMMVARYSHTATLLGDGRVLIAGGADTNNKALGSAELYDPATGGFMATGSIIESRFDHSATLLCDGTVLIVGGSGGNGVVLRSAELYDPQTGTFRAAVGGLAGSGRSGHTATRLCGGAVLIAGGTADSMTYLSTAELYQ